MGFCLADQHREKPGGDLARSGLTRSLPPYRAQHDLHSLQEDPTNQSLNKALDFVVPVSDWQYRVSLPGSHTATVGSRMSPAEDH